MRSTDYILSYEQQLLGYTCMNHDERIHAYRRGCFSTEIPDKEKRDRALDILRYAFKNVLKWDYDVCKEKINNEVIEKQKLTNILKYLDIPEEFNGRVDPVYFTSLIYPEKVKFDRDKLTLDIYKSILENDNKPKDQKVSYPKKFFLEEDGRKRACLCLNYILKKNTFKNLEEVYKLLSEPNKKFINDNKLTLALPNFETPVDFLQESLDVSQQDEFLYTYYKFKYLYNTTALSRKAKEE